MEETKAIEALLIVVVFVVGLRWFMLRVKRELDAIYKMDE